MYKKFNIIGLKTTQSFYYIEKNIILIIFNTAVYRVTFLQVNHRYVIGTMELFNDSTNNKNMLILNHVSNGFLI